MPEPLTPEPQEQQETATSKRHKPLIITEAQARDIHLKLLLARALTLSCYLGLIAVFSLLNIIRSSGSFALWIVQIFPLIIFAPGLFRNIRRAAHRTYSWLCFVSLIYFVAIVPMVMGRALWSDWLITLLVCGLFIGAMMSSRWLQHWNYYLATRKSPKDREH